MPAPIQNHWAATTSCHSKAFRDKYFDARKHLSSQRIARWQMLSDGGYEDGYRASSCFWGTSAGSLVSSYLTANDVRGLKVLDLGCGEGKNANAFAKAGAVVDAVDCSKLAIANGRMAFDQKNIHWKLSDARSHLLGCDQYDIIVMYGLLHCLASREVIAKIVQMAVRKTKPKGLHFVVAFNDGPHDLSAHPNFFPTLAAHSFFVDQYRDQELKIEMNSVIHESHPHNNIPHFHSITRLVVRVVNEVS
ncbi:tellurite methyltransferase [Nitrobacteraceae bacterium AZCC 2161]